MNQRKEDIVCYSPTNPQTLILSFLSPTDRKRTIVTLPSPAVWLPSPKRIRRREKLFLAMKGYGPKMAKNRGTPLFHLKQIWNFEQLPSFLFSLVSTGFRRLWFFSSALSGAGACSEARSRSRRPPMFGDTGSVADTS